MTVAAVAVAAAKTPAVLTTFWKIKTPKATAIKKTQKFSRLVNDFGLRVSKIPAPTITPKTAFNGKIAVTIPSRRISKVPKVRYNTVEASRMSFVTLRTKF